MSLVCGSSLSRRKLVNVQLMPVRGLDGTLCDVAAMHVRGDKLVSASPGLGNDLAIVCACFVVKDLVVNDVVVGLEALHDAIVGRDTVAAVTALEGFNEYGV